MHRKLHILGDYFCDILASNVANCKLPSWGEDLLAKIDVMPGGSAFNSAIHSANYVSYLGHKNVEVGLFCATGVDHFSSIASELLQRHHPIIKDHIVRSSDYSTGTCIVITGKNDRCFVTDRGCVQHMSLHWFQESSLLDSNHIHVGGFYNCNQMQGEIAALYQKAIKENKTTSICPQFDSLKQWGYILEDICPYLTFYISNEYEIKQIAKTDSNAAAAETLLACGCKYVIITMGKQGSVLYTYQPIDSGPENGFEVSHTSQDKVFRSMVEPIPASVPVVDTTGAGDAFVGGFLVEWLLSYDLKQSLRAGCLAGTAAVTLLGGSSCSTEAIENVERLRSVPKSVPIDASNNGSHGCSV